MPRTSCPHPQVARARTSGCCRRSAVLGAQPVSAKRQGEAFYALSPLPPPRPPAASNTLSANSQAGRRALFTDVKGQPAGFWDFWGSGFIRLVRGANRECERRAHVETHDRVLFSFLARARCRCARLGAALRRGRRRRAVFPSAARRVLSRAHRHDSVVFRRGRPRACVARGAAARRCAAVAPSA